MNDSEKQDEGPYVCGEIVEGRMCSVWHKDECSRDAVFMGSGKQAIAVRDTLNQLQSEHMDVLYRGDGESRD